MFLSPGPSSIAFLKSIEAAKLKERGIKILGVAETDDQELESVGPVAKGVYSSLHYAVSLPSEMNQSFVKAVVSRFPKDGPPHAGCVGAYDGMRVIYEALKNTKGGQGGGEAMLAAKRELEVQVENLQARLTMVQVAQAGNQFAVDDGAISQVRQALDEIATRIDVAEKLASGVDEIGSVPVEAQVHHEDLAERISAYFLEDSPSSKSDSQIDQLADRPL
jgi:ABC-type branched-subunit amino acid transport system substrate-binding protein